MTIVDKIKFIEDYKKASNAATGSKYDANSNVTEKNIATMSWEVPKKDNIDLNRALMGRKLREMFNEDIADMYLADLNNHIIYKHDETSLIAPYCASITLYPFIVDGLNKIGGTSDAPKHSDSFSGEFINLLFAVAAQFAGAIATPEFLTYFDYFLRKDFGEDYYQHLNDIVQLGNKPRTLQEKIEGWFQQIVYSINQPAAARGSQSIFWNIAYFDEGYFNSIFNEFYFPDGDSPKWESTKILQKMFMKWFNKERTRKVLTFPVETMNLLTNKGEYVDKDMADFSSEMLAEGHSFFIYRSDSVDALASCCFEGSQKVLTRSSDGGVWLCPIKEIAEETYRGGHKANLKVYHNGSWVPAKTVILPKKDLYKITLANNKELLVTEDHLHPTLRGDQKTENLTTTDYLLTNNMILDTFHEQDLKLTYEQGYLVGLYTGDGSRYERKNCHSCEVIFSLNHFKNDKSKEILEKAAQQLGTTKTFHEYDSGQLYTVKTTSREIKDFLDEWVYGDSADTKNINLNALCQSIDFRKGIIDGMYDSDGGNSNRIYSTSTDLIESLEVILSSLGYNTIIDFSDRRGLVEIKGANYNRNFILYCIRWYDRKNKRSMKDIYTVRNNSVYFKIKSIEPYESEDPNVYCFDVGNYEEPYFTLPNNVITHNCRLRNAIEDNVFSYTLGAGGIQTGSKGVITLNLNRIVQDWKTKDGGITLIDYLTPIIERVHKYLTAFNRIIWDYYDAGLLQVYNAGFITLDKQYLTIGINGFVEGAEYLGIEIDPDNQKYIDYANDILGTISSLNTKNRTTHCRFNTEFVPAESLGNKNAKWDAKEGYWVPRELYNSYFYIVEDNVDAIKKFRYHGQLFTGRCDGGSALHNNLDEHLSKVQYRKLLDVAAEEDCNYFTFNIPNTICNDCGHITKHNLAKCPSCGSTNVDKLTRVIGYLKRISNFSEGRQKEAKKRFYWKDNNDKA